MKVFFLGSSAHNKEFGFAKYELRRATGNVHSLIRGWVNCLIVHHQSTFSLLDSAPPLIKRDIPPADNLQFSGKLHHIKNRHFSFGSPTKFSHK